jgi:hypothetical protein
MLLVRKNPILSDLIADPPKIHALLEEARQNSITGFMEFDFSDFSGLLLLEDGRILQSIKLKRGKSFIIDISEIFEECQKTRPKIGFFIMDKKLVHITLNILNGELLFEKVNSKYVDIRKLLRSLETDNFTGIAVIYSGEEECYIKFETGIPLTCICKKEDEIIENIECLEKLLRNIKNNLYISAYKETRKPDIINALKLISREILGEHVEKIEEMLESSGTTKEELQQTIEEIETLTYLFLDKKKAKTLCNKMKEAIEEVM